MWNRITTSLSSPQLRKWYQIRKEIFKNQNNFIISQIFQNNTDRILPPPLTLYDFKDTSDQRDALLSSQFYRRKKYLKQGESDAVTAISAQNTPPQVSVAASNQDNSYCKWGLSDDEVIGGYSKAKLDMIGTIEEYYAWLQQQQQNDSHVMSSSFTPTTTVDFLPFLRFSGTTDTRIGPTSRAIRSGFCAIRTPRFFSGSMFLRNPYNALEVTCRSDGRIYTVNLKVSSYFPEDLYQSFITISNTRHIVSLQEEKKKKKMRSISSNLYHIPSNSLSSFSSSSSNKTKKSASYTNTETNDLEGNFVRVILPFKDFILTSNGTMRETQRILDGPVELEHIGLTIMDEVTGPFTFDIARIRAVNYYDDMILGEDDEQDEEGI